MKTVLTSFVAWVLVLAGTFSFAQEKNSFIENLSTSEIKTLEALALYPEDIRMAILETAKHPRLLVQIKRLQEFSKEEFKNILLDMPRETQESIWDLTRYRGLIDQLATVENNLKGLQSILDQYPKIIHARASRLHAEHPYLIAQIADLNRLTSDMEWNLYKNEREHLQYSVKTLLDNPDVLAILLEEIELAIIVGDLYLKKPDWVLYKADSMHRALADQNARELTEWKKSIEADPEVNDDLYASMQEYQNEYPYDDLYADNVDWQQYEDYDPDLIVNVIPPHYYYTYPFWYGYPYWYEYPRWRVYPYWYDWGLFPVIRMHTIISIPRFHVVNWYFNRPHHHIRYHRLSAKFIDHYQGHRSHGSSIVSGVKQWQQSNRSIITEEFLSDQKYRSIRLQQFGRMEADRSNYNRKHPDNPLTSATYVQRKRQKYTALVPKSGFSKTLSPRTPVSENKKVTRTSEPKRVSKPEPSQTKEQIRTIDKAKDYHRNHWTKKPPAKAVEPKSSPRTKTVKPVSPKRTPAKKTPVTKKTTPRKKSAGQSQ